MRILVLALLVFTSAHAKTLDRVVAVVQGKAILLSDVQSLRSQIQSSDLLRSFYRIDGGITDRSILNRLVEDQMIRARLKELGTEVTGESVNREVEGIARKNHFTVGQLKSILKKQKVDFENYYEALKTQIERRIIFNREISGSGAMSDDELKALYRTKAPLEYKMSAIVDTLSDKNKNLLVEIASQYRSGKLPLEKLKEHPNYIDLGWLATDELADEIRKLNTSPKAGDALGPIKKSGKYQLFLVEETKRGSDARFEKDKENFRSSVEEIETDQKFKLWFEKQKNQLEVTVNSL